MTDELRKAIVAYCEDNQDEDWETIGVKFGVSAEVAQRVYLESLF